MYFEKHLLETALQQHKNNKHVRTELSESDRLDEMDSVSLHILPLISDIWTSVSIEKKQLVSIERKTQVFSL